MVFYVYSAKDQFIEILNMPVSLIKHKGKEILFFDYKGLTEEDRILGNLYEGSRLFDNATSPLLILIDVNNSSITWRFTTESIRLSNRDREKIKKNAIVGVAGMKKFLLETYNLTSKAPVMNFEDLESAMEYLVED